MSATADDAALVALAQSGDSAAFAELYERYFDRIYDFLARMVRDPDEAADLAQDTFLRAMDSLGSLQRGASFKSWLYTIARNTALNRLERAARTRPLQRMAGDGEEYAYDVVDPDRFGRPDEAAEAAGLAAVVWEAAEALDPRAYSVLHLSVRDGLDSAEIAEVLGVTRNNAYVMVNRMKKAVEDAIGALVLFRSGRRQCSDLDAMLAQFEVAEMSADTRRAIERHAAGCATCSERRRRLASPFAVFAAFAPLHAEASVRDAILEDLMQSFAGHTAAGPAEAAPIAPTAPSFVASTAKDGTPSEAPAASGHSPARIEAGTAATTPPPRRTRRYRLAAATIALLLLVGIGAPAGALALLGSNGPEAVATPAIAAGVLSTESTPPTSASAGFPTSTGTSQAIEGTVTGTSTPAEGATQPVLGTPTASTPAATPAASASGATTPPLGAPPAGTPDNPGSSGGPAGADESSPPPATLPSATQAPGTQPPPAAACTPSLSVSPLQLAFDASADAQAALVSGDGCGSPLTFTAAPGATWITVAPAGGSIAPGSSQFLTIHVDRSDRAAGSGHVHIASTAGTYDILVTVETPGPPTTTPTPSRTPDACGGTVCPTLTPPPRRPGGLVTP